MEEEIVEFPNRDNKGVLTTSATKVYNRTTISLFKTFRSMGHKPSPEMREALRDLICHLCWMAQGDCPPKFYLSSLDPGVGKTQTIVHFLKALVAFPELADVGVLIGVSRIDEIWALADACDLPGDTYAVFTSDADLNDLGGSPQTSQVLFTTQQMIQSRAGGGRLSDIPEFCYNGKVRAVRVWDETLDPALPVTLARDELFRLIPAYRRLNSGLADDLDSLAQRLGEAEDNCLFEVPDLGSKHKLDLSSGLSLLWGQPEDVQTAAKALWSISGQNAWVRKDGTYGNTLVTYKEHLPSDMAPLVILDASGNVRKTYLWWEQRRGDLVRLKEARKDYSNLTVHLWDQAVSKSAYGDRDKSARILQGIAKTIEERPDEEWLVVCHKLPKRDLEKELRGLVKAPQENLHFITWGSHRAINDYVHVPNVILAGTLFFRTSQYDAIGRAAADFSPDEGSLEERHEQIMRLSEMGHQVLQAIGRGTVRRAEGDQCGRCNAYVIVSQKWPIRKAVDMAFPKAKVEKWLPISPVLTGKVKDAAEYLTERLRGHPKAVVRFKEVGEHLGDMSAANFNKNIRKHPSFQQFLADEDFDEYIAPGKKQARAFANGFFAAFGDEAVEEDGYVAEPWRVG